MHFQIEDFDWPDALSGLSPARKRRLAAVKKEIISFVMAYLPPNTLQVSVHPKNIVVVERARRLVVAPVIVLRGEFPGTIIFRRLADYVISHTPAGAVVFRPKPSKRKTSEPR